MTSIDYAKRLIDTSNAALHPNYNNNTTISRTIDHG